MPPKKNNRPRKVLKVIKVTKRISKPKAKRVSIASRKNPPTGRERAVASVATSASGLALAICVPGSCPNLRLKGNAADSVATGAMSLHYAPTFKQPSTKATYSTMPTGTSYMALFRDVLRSAVVFIANPSGFTHSYAATFGTTAGTALTTSILSGGVQPGGSSIQLNPLYYVASYTATYIQPHGAYLYLGVSQDQSYVWMDYGDVATFTQGQADTSARVEILNYDGDAAELAVTAVFGALTTTYTCAVATGGYFHFTYVTTNATAPANQTVAIVIVGTGDSFGHKAVPNANNHFNQLTRVRVNAASMMATPTSSVLNQSGTLYAANLESSNLWYSNLTSDILTVVPNEFRGEFPFQKGLYTFLKPTAEDMQFDNIATLTSGAVTSLGYDLDKPSRYSCILLNSDIASAVSPGLEWLATFFWDLEFQTSDQWYETHKSSASYLETVAAIEAVSDVPLFHENPLHWSDITSALNRGFQKVRSFLPAIANIFSSFLMRAPNPWAKTAGALLSGASTISQAFPGGEPWKG